SLFAMEHEQTAQHVFNLGTGVPTTLDRLARTLAQVFDKPRLAPVYRGCYRPSDVRHLVLNPGQLADLGFRARTRLEEGLRNVAQWLRATHPEVPELFRAAEHQLVQYGVVRKAHATV